MGLVNPPQVQPGVIRALYRCYAQQPADWTASEDELKALLAPPASDASSDPDSPVHHSIREASHLGMIIPVEAGKKGGHLQLALERPSSPLDTVENERELATNLRRLVLRDVNNTDLFKAERGALDTGAAREFTRIACWMLLQDSHGAPLHYGGAQPEGEVQVLIDRECKMPLVVTDVRWNNFRRWARYLGLARADRTERLIPDPTAAVSEELDEVFRGESNLSVGEFLSRLAERLPVLDGGRFRETVVEAALKRAPTDGEVSSALSLALRRLRRAKRLELEASHDAPEARMIGEEEITHVSDRRST